MQRRSRMILVFVALLTLIAVVIDFPTYRYDFNAFGRQFQGTLRGPDVNFVIPFTNTRVEKELKVWLGLDLQGGLQLTYSADMTDVPAAERADKIQEVVNKIERRVNQLGVSEPLIQSSVIGDSYRAIVELPGVTDLERARALIGQTAQLDFREYIPQAQSIQLKDEEGNPIDTPTESTSSYVPVGLTGDDFSRAWVDTSGGTSSTGAPVPNQPIVGFEFKPEAAETFSNLTQRLSNTGGILAIFLDNQIIFEGRTAHIPDGKGQITGLADVQAAKDLSIALNEGALPVPIEVVSEKVVSASLGQDAVNKSVIAGIIGFLAIAVLMISFYHLPGLVSVIALGLYTLFTLAIFKLVPVTLTLAGIGGFILSVGMAVDANVLIFERFKEELRAGRSLLTAMEIGFSRAWNSIRDSNVSSLITSGILFYFGSGTIRGFALTLSIGILVSMITAITITRHIMLLLVRSGRFDSLMMYGTSSNLTKE